MGRLSCISLRRPPMLAVAAAIVTWAATAQANDGSCGAAGCDASYPPPAAISAMDMPLRYYFMPRRPGCPQHDFRYRVAPPAVNMCGSGCGWGLPVACDAIPCCTVSPERSGDFLPLEFERLGTIPNDSLIEAVGPAGR